MGAGYEYMDEAMHGQFTWQMLAILAGLKIVATLLSFVSGTPGGMFAPTLFIGAMLGASVGGAEHALLPHLAASPGTYALVGMGVLFAGFLRAPMTSVFMVLEVSGNYSIIVPVIVANTIAYAISRGLQPTAIFDVLTRQDGLDLPSMEEQREEGILRVEDAMRPPTGPVLDAEELLVHALQRTDENRNRCSTRSIESHRVEQSHQRGTRSHGRGGQRRPNPRFRYGQPQDSFFASRPSTGYGTSAR